MSAFSSYFYVLLLMVTCVVGLWLVIRLLASIGWCVGQLVRIVVGGVTRLANFVSGMVSDTLRIVGGVLTAAFFVPFVVGNIATGRWSRANYYGHVLEREAVAVGAAAYRVGIGHVGRLFGLTSLTDGIERRIPEAMARAPGRDTPRAGKHAFEGYTVVGSLPSGGSGARLFLAEPLPDKRSQWARAGSVVPDRVVIKSFSLGDGSTMPQIVRESRALEAARRLGLVLEHELGAQRFHYVMPFVPGDDLSVVTQRLHDDAGRKGLGERQLELAMSYTADLLQVVQRFHQHGLWHKDIKPSNIIVSEGRVHLVDLGLTTPLRSAMTLTTHGTEYFRDPELVRLALRGVKVHEVDGVKFDIYGVGAVLYSVLENNFPAHGSLSQIHLRCPEALRWIVRRAMADMGKRYASAAEMLADVRTVASASDPFAVTPATLPSVRGDSQLVASIEAEGLAAADRPLAAALAPAAPDAAIAADTMRQPRRRHSGERWGGVHWVAAAAAGLFVVVALGGMSLFFVARVRSPLHDEASVPAPQLLLGTPGPGGASAHDGNAYTSHLILAQQPRLAEFADPLSKREDASLRWERLAPTLATHRSEPARMLVLDDVGPRLDAATRSRLDLFYSALETAGFELIGIGRSQTLSADEETILLGDVRHLIGQAVSWDEELQQQLRSLLTGQGGRVSTVLALDQGDVAGTVRPQFACVSQTDADDLMLLLGGVSAERQARKDDAPRSDGDGFVYSVY